MAHFIFDLDGTVIDTGHRYRNGPDGHIDLQFWFDNSTPEMIAKDRLLPLSIAWRLLYSIGHNIIVCTARNFSPLNGVDLGAIYTKFLWDNNLRYHALLHRTMAGPDHETLGDGDLKIRLLNDYFRSVGYRDAREANATMYDDNLKVIAAMSQIGITCHDATESNDYMRKRGLKAA